MIKIDPSKLQEFRRKAVSMDPRDLEGKYVSLRLLVAAVDLAIVQGKLDPRCPIADVRLDAGIPPVDRAEAMQILFGVRPEGD